MMMVYPGCPIHGKERWTFLADTNERGEYEVVSKAVTSKLHAQAERTNKQKRLL